MADNGGDHLVPEESLAAAEEVQQLSCASSSAYAASSVAPLEQPALTTESQSPKLPYLIDTTTNPPELPASNSVMLRQLRWVACVCRCSFDLDIGQVINITENPNVKNTKCN